MYPAPVALIAAAAAAVLSPVGVALAQPYPSRPIRVVVPFSAGGAADILARLVGQKLGESMGQQVVIDNRPGAGGTLGSGIVAKAPPDGYSLMVTSSAHAINPSIYNKLPYDTNRDFATLTPLAVLPSVLVAHASVAAKSVPDLVTLAKTKPGALNYGSAGSGSTLHLAAELFKSKTSTDVVHVAYKGNPEVITDLLGGRIQLSFLPVINVLPFKADNRVRFLAVTTTKRSSLLPDLPTIAEAGVKDYAFEAWWAAFAPAATPRPIQERLNREIRRAMESPEGAARFAEQGAEPLYKPLPEAGAFVRAEIDKMAQIVKAAGIARIN